MTVEPLKLRKKPAEEENTKFTRKIRSDHGYPMLRLPKAVLQIGLKLNSEVIVEKKVGSNPLNWEIVITPSSSKP